MFYVAVPLKSYVGCANKNEVTTIIVLSFFLASTKIIFKKVIQCLLLRYHCS